MVTCLALIMALVACTDFPVEPAVSGIQISASPIANGLTVTPPTPILEVDGTVQLEAHDTAGNRITPNNWSSNNSSVATVSSSGVVTARAAGIATITARANRGQWGTAVITVAVPAPPPPPPGAGALPRLKVEGRNIVTDAGEPVILRGVNIMRSEWDLRMNWERQAIPHVSSVWKGNVILRGFAADPVVDPAFLWVSSWGQTVTHANYMRWLDEYVSLGKANGLYVIFAFRSYGINTPQPGMPDNPDGKAARALAFLAARYKHEPHVMYALQVEPHDHAYGPAWATLRPLFESMVDSLHSASEPHKPIVLIPGNYWSRDISGAINDPVRRENVVYKTHPYNSQEDFDRYFMNAHRAGLPVFIGEFGPYGAMRMSDVEALLELAAANNLGWAAWNFDDEALPALLRRPRGDFLPTEYGLRIKNAMERTPAIPGR